MIHNTSTTFGRWSVKLFRFVFLSAIAILSVVGEISCSSKDSDFDSLFAKSREFVKSSQYAEALPFAEQAFTIAMREFGWRNESTLNVAHNLGLILSEVGPFDRAESLLVATAGYDSLVFGPQSGALALTFFNLAGAYNKQEKFSRAIEYYERVLSLRSGSKHATLAMSNRFLADIYTEMGWPKKGLEYADRAFELESKLLSKMSPDRTVNLLIAAEALAQIGDYRTADTLLQYAGRIGEAYWGKKSNFFALWYLAKGGRYSAMGSFDSASTCYHSARDLIKSLGVDAPRRTAQAFVGLAETESKLGNPNSALAYCDSANAIPQRRPVSASKIRGRIERVRAEVSGKSGDKTNTEKFLRSALSEFATIESGRNSYSCATLLNLAQFERARNRNLESDSLYHEALEIAEIVFGLTAPATVKIREQSRAEK